MTQEVFPEIQAATEAVQARILLTEKEIAEMKEAIVAKKAELRSWRKAVDAFIPRRKALKKRAAVT